MPLIRFGTPYSIVAVVRSTLGALSPPLHGISCHLRFILPPLVAKGSPELVQTLLWPHVPVFCFGFLKLALNLEPTLDPKSRRFLRLFCLLRPRWIWGICAVVPACQSFRLLFVVGSPWPPSLPLLPPLTSQVFCLNWCGPLDDENGSASPICRALNAFRAW